MNNLKNVLVKPSHFVKVCKLKKQKLYDANELFY